jgi:hypothetical protein
MMLKADDVKPAVNMTLQHFPPRHDPELLSVKPEPGAVSRKDVTAEVCG